MSKQIAIIPEPVRLDIKGGKFPLSPSCQVVAEGSAVDVARWFARSIATGTGLELAVNPSVSANDAGLIWFHLDAGLKSLGSEGYRLSVTTQRVDLFAPEPAGLFYAAQTIRQLLPPEIFNSTPLSGIEWSIPCVEVEDFPRFGWRGSMMDVGRHFMPKEFVFKFIDLLALHKLNTFHWHLTEDQGWRIEIKKYPRLTEVGAWRKETVVGRTYTDSPNPVYDGKPHGGFYTQAEVREVVEYARQRFIRVVPEIELPGHCQAAIAAYPELGNTGQKLEVGTLWGIYEHVYNVEETTFRFLFNVLEEVLGLFPGQFIHIGGDEVPKKEWKQSAAAQNRLQELGLANEDELQSYFIRRIDRYLSGHGRRLVGWDEILEGGLARGATVMSWRGEEGGITAANAGHDVVMAPHQHTYLNYQQTREDSTGIHHGDYLPLTKVYGYEPVPAAIDPGKAQHVLGSQAQLWSEFIPDSLRMEYMAYPRLCALSEVVWTPAAKKDIDSFTTRIQTHLQRLDRQGVNYCKQIE